MSSTQILDDTRQIVPRRATAYTPGADGAWLVEMSNWDQTGDGAVQTTVEDLAKWDANFYAPAVGDSALVAMLSTPGLGDYGFGLWRQQYHHETVVWHTGSWAGYRAVIMRFPARRRSIIALCNRSEAHTYRLATQLADVLMPDTSPATTYPPVRVPDAAGLYSSDAVGDILRVTQSGDGVMVENGESHHALLPFAGGVLRDTSDGLTYAFGNHRVIVQSYGDVPDTMRRVPPPASRIGGEFNGTYRSLDLDETWTVRLQANAPVARLIVHRPRGEDLVLTPLYRDGFMTDDGTPVHFRRDASGQITVLSITTGGVHDLRFSRERHVTDRAR